MNQLVRVPLPLEAYKFAVYYQEEGETLAGRFPDLADANRRGDREAVERWFDEHTVVSAAHRSDFDPAKWDGNSPINGWVLWRKAVIEKVGSNTYPASFLTALILGVLLGYLGAPKCQPVDWTGFPV